MQLRNMYEISGRRILITGGESMLGRAIGAKLTEMDASVFPLSHRDYDLLDLDCTFTAFESIRPHYVIHCAGFNGNIGFNEKYPADIYGKTMLMAINVLEASVGYKVDKVVSLISSCAYPDLGGKPLKETDFWAGEPNRSVDAHGFAKRGIMEYGRQIVKQHGIMCIGMCVNTCYGPHDNFSVEKTKVVGGLIKKFSEAKKNGDPYVECWGTGKAKREFIFSEDVGKYLPLVLQKCNHYSYPTNVGSGKEYEIRELAEKVKKAVGYEGEIKWDTTKPDGQMSKLLDNTMIRRLCSNLEFTELDEGLERTVDWYVKHNSSNN